MPIVYKCAYLCFVVLLLHDYFNDIFCSTWYITRTRNALLL